MKRYFIYIKILVYTIYILFTHVFKNEHELNTKSENANAHVDEDVVIKHVVVPPEFTTNQALSFLIQATTQVAN